MTDESRAGQMPATRKAVCVILDGSRFTIQFKRLMSIWSRPNRLVLN